MALKTIAFDAATALGWDVAELSKRSGIPVKTLYAVRAGDRKPGPKTIAGIMRAFPHLPFERLFVLVDSTFVAASSSSVAEPAEAAA